MANKENSPVTAAQAYEKGWKSYYAQPSSENVKSETECIIDAIEQYASLVSAEKDKEIEELKTKAAILDRQITGHIKAQKESIDLTTAYADCINNNLRLKEKADKLAEALNQIISDEKWLSRHNDVAIAKQALSAYQSGKENKD